VIAAVAGGVVLLAGLALPAGASHTNQPDPNDTPGKLDLEAVELAHDSGPPRWRFVAFAHWTIRQIWDHGFLVVRLDTRGDHDVDYLLLVRSDGRRLVSTLFRVRADGKQHRIGTATAGKSGPRAAIASVALRKLDVGPARTSYFWSALSSFTGGVCRQTCLDLVPDEGMIEQPLPGVTPTPTPSPTPSPSPTP
jgi:hypothetical protein